ncbi:MAG: 2-hydroxyacyl-CoA dehydratase [Clostridia bacterium]|nr:2-hydroxyacyl-CoA dehydratase [Clostridia bacterium]
MAQLMYDKGGRLLFTEEMRQEYTILFPQMLPIHFTMLEKVFRLHGYNAVMLTTNHNGIAQEGLKYVHNDTCYPALLVIGQMMDAIKNGGYDPHKIALMITQTGGGCRASNYIHLLRKALQRAGYEYIPVISLNLSGMEKNPGFKLSLPMILQIVHGIVYGDLIMNLANQCRPYELHKGDTDALVKRWTEDLVKDFERGFRAFRHKHARDVMRRICADFASIPMDRSEPRVRVGVVGEIYVKYSPLGNNNLEAFLQSEDCETVVPGVLDFAMFKCDNRSEDHKLYGGRFAAYTVSNLLKKVCRRYQNDLIEMIGHHDIFRKPCTFDHLKTLVKGYLGYGNKMGEGWLLTGEMLELIDSGTHNIVCTQPFGCLPNHVAGKGMVRPIKQRLPHANIVCIDYDPGATRINQENRIKLMLANARMQAKKATPSVAAGEKEKEPLSV